MEVLGYLASIVIGIILGLIGGGGSILTVPVLVYLFDIDPVIATGYSLFIVGSTAAIGAVKKYNQGLTVIRIGLAFGIPSLIGVFASRSLLLPLIPDIIFSSEYLILKKGMALMLLFALIMLLASWSMIRNREDTDVPLKRKLNYPLIASEGVVVGIITGLVGAGGGFLIVPALVLLTGLPMKWAVGTSLMIIAIKSTIGFSGDVLSGQNIDWIFLILITALAILGIFIGSYLTKQIDGSSLKKGFGWFVLVMAVFIILKELFFSS